MSEETGQSHVFSKGSTQEGRQTSPPRPLPQDPGSKDAGHFSPLRDCTPTQASGTGRGHPQE